MFAKFDDSKMSDGERFKMYAFLGDILLTDTNIKWFEEFHDWYLYEGGHTEDYLTITDKIILLASRDN